jgi:hypothetical protein
MDIKHLHSTTDLLITFVDSAKRLSVSRVGTYSPIPHHYLQLELAKKQTSPSATSIAHRFPFHLIQRQHHPTATPKSLHTSTTTTFHHGRHNPKPRHHYHDIPYGHLHCNHLHSHHDLLARADGSDHPTTATITHEAAKRDEAAQRDDITLHNKLNRRAEHALRKEATLREEYVLHNETPRLDEHSRLDDMQQQALRIAEMMASPSSTVPWE